MLAVYREMRFICLAARSPLHPVFGGRESRYETEELHEKVFFLILVSHLRFFGFWIAS